MLNLDSFYKARYALSRVIRRTDLVRAPKLNPEADIYLKPENLQVTGSFKVRGACYKIACLTEQEKKHGVIACSAGNHAQGVALGASCNGIKSIICLPDGAPISKVEATRGYGAEICLVPGVYDDAYQQALSLRDQHGYTFIHPFDDENVIAGQGTIGLELLEQLPDVQVVIVPISKGDDLKHISERLQPVIDELRSKGISVKYDDSDNKRPGFKFADYELKGVPVRLVMGARDLENGTIEVMRRDTLEKETHSIDGIAQHVEQLLEDIQKNIFEKARSWRDSRVYECDNYEEFKERVKDGGFFLCHWDGTAETEAKIKEETQATIRCVPFAYEQTPGIDMVSGKPSKARVIIARSY